MNSRKTYLTIVIVVFALTKIASAQFNQTSASPTQPNQTARITQGPTIEYADDRFAVISWTTEAPSESRVFYGNDPTNLTQVAEGAPNTTTHRVHLPNLLPSTKYYFQIETGQAGSPGQPTESFQTVAAGGQALRNQRPVRVASATPPSPVITRGPTIQYADDRSAVISWTTDRPAPTVVYYGNNSSNLAQTAEQGTTATTSHRVHLHNLSPRTTYFFQVDTGQTPGVAMTTYIFQTSASGAPPVFDRAAAQGTTGTVPQTNASQVNTGAPATSSAQTNTPAQSDTTEQSEEPVLAQRPRQTVYKGGLLVPAGTEFSASLDGPLSSKTSKPGDEFTASITQPIRAQNGTVALPSGTRLRGQVSNVEQGKILASVRGKARMDLRFTEVVLPNGTVLPVTATLLGVGQKTGASTGQEGEVTDKTQGKEVAKDVGIGAGLGTVAGLIFGSALKGLAIGAIAGGGYVLATQGRDVQIPADSQLNIRLDHQLSVPPPSARPNQQQTTEQQPDTTGP
ncbi:MAG TPA: fibronectin type III domain-containing protein [Terriglobales bacterium]|nr:fibronectin type III domain-containing protein [Terriglobales bacterium]